MADNLANMMVLILPDTKYRSKAWFRLSDKIDSIKKLLGIKEVRRIVIT
jgi:hypothetical protein